MLRKNLALIFLTSLVACALAVVPPLSCPPSSPKGPATKVTELHPGNIDVVIGLGDSITAGFAMEGYPPQDLLEFRGKVFSIGGDELTVPIIGSKTVTIPRWLLHYNKNLQGQAFGETLPLTRGSYLDGAVSGAKVQGVPDQIDYIVKTLKMQYNHTIDFEKSWKLITLFIGANNLCICCTKGNTSGQTETYEKLLDGVLAQIKREIPRSFVNLVPIFNISGVYEAGQGDAGRKIMDEHSVAYNQVMSNLAKKYQPQNTGDWEFTVVAQPGISGVNITAWGESYLSKLDCFHPGLDANELFTLAIWNNMFTPEGKKDRGSDIGPSNIPPPICPTQDSVLQ